MHIFHLIFQWNLSQKRVFFGKMAGSRSFPGKFELYRSKYSKQNTLIISSYGETQANSYFSRNRNPKLTRLVICHFFSPLPAPSGGFYDFLRDIIWDYISKLLLLMGCRTNSDEHLSQNVRNSRITPSLSHWWKFHNLYMYRGGYK